MKGSTLKYGVLAAALMGAVAGVQAAGIPEFEPNDTAATAQNVDGNFTLDADANITDSTTVPHVSVSATGDSTNDFYRFTSAAGGRVIVDIDANSFDSEIGIWDAGGTLLSNNDDNAGDPGSNGFASYLDINLLGPGVYTVGVCQFNCEFGNSFAITGNPVPDGASYTLHVSHVTANIVYEERAVPALGLSGLALLAGALGVAGFVRARRRD